MSQNFLNLWEKKLIVFKPLNNYRMSQILTELTLIIEFKRHIESSFENKTQNILIYSKRN